MEWTELLIAGLHGPRHTFLTEAGKHIDPFTLQYIAGHDNIEDDYALCSPQANAWEAVPLSGANGSAELVQNPMQSQLPLTGCLGKQLKIRRF